MKTLIGSLFVALVAAAFAYQLGKKAPDVRYSLSERIPVTFSTADEVPSESVQRLEIRNIGNDEARDVQVKLNARVTWHKLLKHSEKSAPVIFADRVPFELVYPSLPPETSIVLIFRSTGSVQNAAVSVRHSEGTATEALAKTGASWANWAIWLMISFNLFTSSFTLFTEQRSRADRRLLYKTLSELIEAEKPVFVSHGTWQSAFRAALVKRAELGGDTAEELQRSETTVILNLPRPSQVDEILWAEVQAAAAKAYERAFRQQIKGSRTSVELLYGLQRPSALSEAVWLELQDDLRKRHVAEVTPRPWDHDGIRKLLRSVPPQLEGTEEWSKLHQHLQDEHVRLLTERMTYTVDPLSRLEDADLALLDLSRRDKLRDLAYETQIVHYTRSVLASSTKSVLALEKPEWIRDVDFTAVTRVAQMEQQASDAKEEAYRARAALLRDREEVATLKDRLEWQLQTVDSVLTDPTAADRIEDYSDRFAPGNLANLKRLAQAARRDGRAKRQSRSSQRTNPKR